MSVTKDAQEPSSKYKCILTIGNQPIYLVEDWEHGIGGGLWSTGLAMAKYFASMNHHPHDDSRRHDVDFSLLEGTVLELGSGNGFLSVCLLAACPKVTKVVVTDTKEHLPLMRQTIFEANPAVVPDDDSTKVSVQEYVWGSGAKLIMAPENENEIASFDWIVGSDLAYRDELHDPLIAALCQYSSSHTITLLGVTMCDTKPVFFRKLTKAGFIYERLADHLLEAPFRGTSFAIFAIRRVQWNDDH